MSSRTLTIGEISLAQKIFKDSIDYTTVKVHDEKHNLLQKDGTAVTPNGEIYFPPEHHIADFSIGTPEQRATFIHEMVHVWQHQNKLMNVIAAAAIEAARYGFFWQYKAYQYTLDESKDLLDYRIEQQAAIIEDYYRMQFEGTRRSGSRQGGINMQNRISRAKAPNALRRILMQFIANPKYARNPANCMRIKQAHARPALVCKGS